MDMNRLQDLIVEAIVEHIATQVIERLATRSRQALVLFTGTELGLNKAAFELKTLKEEGFALHSVLTAGGRKMLTPERSRALGLEMLLSDACSNSEPEADSLLDGRGLVLIPTLSITTAAKVANCIRDCLGATLVARALERGIPVIAAVDGCCPDNPNRQADLFMVSEAYKARLRAHIECLQSYGIQLVRAGKLAEAARVRMTLPVPSNVVGRAATTGSVESALSNPRLVTHSQVASLVSKIPSPLFSATPSMPITVGKKLFSRTDALNCTEGSELRLARNIVVTPLAMDVLRSRNVRLIQP